MYLTAGEPGVNSGNQSCQCQLWLDLLPVLFSTFTDFVHVSFHYILKDANVYIQKSYTFLIFISSHLSIFFLFFLIAFSVDYLVLFYSRGSVLSSAILMDKLASFCNFYFENLACTSRDMLKNRGNGGCFFRVCACV